MSNYHNAVMAAKKIINDLTARKGLGNEFYACDSDIQQEIEDEWRKIIFETYEKESK